MKLQLFFVYVMIFVIWGIMTIYDPIGGLITMIAIIVTVLLFAWRWNVLRDKDAKQHSVESMTRLGCMIVDSLYCDKRWLSIDSISHLVFLRMGKPPHDTHVNKEITRLKNGGLIHQNYGSSSDKVLYKISSVGKRVVRLQEKKHGTLFENLGDG